MRHGFSIDDQLLLWQSLHSSSCRSALSAITEFGEMESSKLITSMLNDKICAQRRFILKQAYLEDIFLS
jgi:hypothetical protein